MLALVEPAAIAAGVLLLTVATTFSVISAQSQ